MTPPIHDTRYLQELVGDALSRGCAATVAAQPNDPVDYLGQWLLRYVKNAEIVGDYAKEKEGQLQARKQELEAAAEAAAKVKREQQIRREAIIELSKMSAEPRMMLQRAVEVIVKYTSAGAAYAASVADPEEPDWQFPEDPEDPAAAESDDEADPVPPPPPAEGEEGAPPPEADPPAEADAGADAASKPKVQRLIDYSKKYLSYLAASTGQDFMNSMELRRPAPPPEDDPEAKVEPTPLTFRILDERRPMVYTSNTAFEPAMRFFRNFPKIGAYQACGVQSPATGEFKAIIAADTLFPEGQGQALSQEDQDFIWHVSRALSTAMEAVELRQQQQQQQSPAEEGEEPAKASTAKDVIEGLKQTLICVYNPSGATPGDAPAEGEAPAEGDAAPAEEAAPAEGEGGDDPVAVLKAEIKGLEVQLKESVSAREKSKVALDKAETALSSIKEVVQNQGEASLPVLRHMRLVPQATFHVLKAVLHVLGKDPETFANWKRVFHYFTADLFNELKGFDATQERDLEKWKAARCCYKALGEEGAKKLDEELPETMLGTLLLMWLKHVRKVARRALAYRGCVATEEGLLQSLSQKKVDLEEAEKKKAEEEEAARKAAEEAAAAEAAAAAAGEGGEEAAEEE